MRHPLVVGNWKMNKTASEAGPFVRELRERVRVPHDVHVALAPPFTSLPAVRDVLGPGAPFLLAAQDVFWEERGAYTGAVSPLMLRDLGCTFVIIGHSERRRHFGDTDETVHRKLMAALRHDLHPILCLGESLAEREHDRTDEVITHQLTRALDGVTKDALARATVAYEPVWAIGTGRAATAAQAGAVHALVRRLLVSIGGDAAEHVRILYGGSVTPANAAELLRTPQVDGALVGGACLDADAFARIVGEAGAA